MPMYSRGNVKAFIEGRKPFFQAVLKAPESTFNWLERFDKQQAIFFKRLLKQLAFHYFHDENQWLEAGRFCGRLLQHSHYYIEKELIQFPDLLDLLTLFDKITIQRYQSAFNTHFSELNLETELLHFHYDCFETAFARKDGYFLSISEYQGVGVNWLLRDIQRLGVQDDILYHQIMAHYSGSLTRNTGEISKERLSWLKKREVLFQRVVAYRLTQRYSSQLLLVQQLDESCDGYERYLKAHLEVLSQKRSGRHQLIQEDKFSKQIKSANDKLEKLAELRGLLKETKPSAALYKFKQCFLSEPCQSVMRHRDDNYAAVFIEHVLDLLSHMMLTLSHLFKMHQKAGSTSDARLWASRKKDRQYVDKIKQKVCCATDQAVKLRI